MKFLLHSWKLKQTAATKKFWQGKNSLKIGYVEEDMITSIKRVCSHRKKILVESLLDLHEKCTKS